MTDPAAVAEPGPAPVRTPLDAGTVLAHLRRRGVLAAAEPATVTTLTGGVSSTVLAVQTSTRRIVVKQALPRLRVAATWIADPGRTVGEAAAMRVLHGITPDRTPMVLDLDPEQIVLTMSGAPPGTRTWKDDLMDGVVDAAVARCLGSVLGRWQSRTGGDPGIAAAFGDDTVLRQLRTDPFFGPIPAAEPAVAPALAELVDSMDRHRAVLVHGDFSPKNVLVWPDGVWVVDYEVAHHGDPAFDPAFLLAHLALKAIHLPESAGELGAAAREFCAAYAGETGRPAGVARTCSFVGALLLARTLGKSPADYLSPAGRTAARDRGRELLLHPVDGWDALCDRIGAGR